MKRFLLFSSFILLFTFCNNNPLPGVDKGENQTRAQVKTEVYYFHMTRRCATCQAVENEARNMVTDQYAEMVKSGLLSFRSLNYEEPEGKEIADKLGVTGQVLLVVKGDVKKDLTGESFMYALSKPEKMRELLKKTLDEMLK